MPAMEPERVASSVPGEKPEVPSDQVCEPALTSVPVGILGELGDEEWLIDQDCASHQSHPCLLLNVPVITELSASMLEALFFNVSSSSLNVLNVLRHHHCVSQPTFLSCLFH